MQMSDVELMGIKIILDLIGNVKLCSGCSFLYVDEPLFEHDICSNFITNEEYMQMLESKLGLCDSDLNKSYVLLHFSDDYLNLLLACWNSELDKLHKGIYYACDLRRKDRNIYEFIQKNLCNYGVWQVRRGVETHVALDAVLNLFIHYFMNKGNSMSAKAYRIALEKLNALGDEFA